MSVPGYILIAIAAYLVGSIPTGFLIAKARGIDIRAVGSGNIGATNAFRVLGKPAGTLVLLVDALKGFGAAALVLNNYPSLHEALPNIFPQPGLSSLDIRFNLAVVAGLFSVLGHNYTCWLHFKGGKGIATSAGVYLALAPVSLGIALATWIVLALTTRYVSVASIGAATALPLAVWLIETNVFLGVITTALGALAIFKHRNNLQRLMNGTESRIGQKARTAEATK